MSANLEHEVDARGSAYIILALDLAPFVKPSSRETLEHIRGGGILDDYLESLNLNNSSFSRDLNYRNIEQEGYELEIFNHILLKDNFAPTYRVNKEYIDFAPQLRSNVQFKDIFLSIWEKWDFWFRLTRNGVITIVMKLAIPRRRALIHIARDVLGVQVPFDMESARNKMLELETGLSNAHENVANKIKSVREFMDWVDEHSLVDVEQDRRTVVWQMAVTIIQKFIEACGGRLHHNVENGFDIELTSEIERSILNPLRERYTMFHFEEITHYDRQSNRHQPISPAELLSDPNYSRLISSLLEGIMLEGRSSEKQNDKALFFPIHSDLSANRISNRDCSSWEDEFCIIAQRSTAIYSLPLEGQRIIFPLHRIKYSNYWQCIIRGLEFAVETKVLAQVSERMTSEYLDEVLPLLRGNNGPLDPKRIHAFSEEVSNSMRLMAHLRTITVPQIIARASYAIDKFEHFFQETGIDHIVAHADANLDDLNELLERHYDLELQIESQRSNEVGLATSIIFASLTLSLAILTLPSFIQDWESQNNGFLSHQWYYNFLPQLGGGVVWGLAILCVMAISYGLPRLLSARLRRKPRLW